MISRRLHNIRERLMSYSWAPCSNTRTITQKEASCCPRHLFLLSSTSQQVGSVTQALCFGVPPIVSGAGKLGELCANVTGLTCRRWEKLVWPPERNRRSEAGTRRRPNSCDVAEVRASCYKSLNSISGSLRTITQYRTTERHGVFGYLHNTELHSNVRRVWVLT
jgi:hypothetical protein